MNKITTHFYEITFDGSVDALWTYTVASDSRAAHSVAAPVFEIDGTPVAASLQNISPVRPPETLGNGTTEYAFTGRLAEMPGMSLEMIFRAADDSPVVRFCYVLRSEKQHRLTRTSGSDSLSYMKLSMLDMHDAFEVRFSEFNEFVHSFTLSERKIEDRDFENELHLMGPMVAGQCSKCPFCGDISLLAAYEHGSQIPDAFVGFALGQYRTISINAVKGNYYNGRIIDAGNPFDTIWFEFAAIDGDTDMLAGHYRKFVLNYMTLNAASRKPYIFYNTWAHQERNKWWNGKKFLDSMHQERMLAEIDIAHRMGIEVFVLDTGWYEKTGDWRVSLSRFPDGLKAVREKLDGYGMKLGLWFNPLAAARTSRMYEEHKDCVMSWDGKISGPHGIWETEESFNLCIASRYWEAFADELIRLVREVGVTYFKWDAIGQYGCNDANHLHGTADATLAERADCYAFEQVRYMTRVVDKLCAQCPEAIVDFDITEGHRSVGLAWLAAGKYFLINNGPYYGNYNIPIGEVWSNIFVYPGPARPWVCRVPLSFDKWIPSVLFLTHYLPDDPADSQLINIASLILGQNGIWGELLAISDDGVKLFGDLLGTYRKVRDDITAASPVRTGDVAGSPEVHEKINPATGRGAVVIFSSAAGKYTYVTANKADAKRRCTGAASVKTDAAGRAVIEATFKKAGAEIVFFGVEG